MGWGVIESGTEAGLKVEIETEIENWIGVGECETGVEIRNNTRNRIESGNKRLTTRSFNIKDKETRCTSTQGKLRAQGQICHMAFWASAQGPVDSRGPRLSQVRQK
ncbi:hypothetical protein EVAR_5922_1 [Eumeta japonica]|uniref:Uncharacterized protein n=1 Tax=Eumeta variegata TaxID=151549 RepID=A0A4C1TFA8_EUMVA|nr:hypothetical protein EVAR_5922_1 [Eumeta japonica]